MRSIKKQTVTITPFVPSIVLNIAKSPDLHRYNLSSIRMVMSGEAPMRKELEDTVRAKLPNAKLEQVMCTDHVQERREVRELIEALPKDRKMSDLPKITHPTLIIWGEHDLVSPMELAHHLKRQIGESAEIVTIKNAGDAINVEKSKVHEEMQKFMKSFLLDALPQPKQEKQSNGHKVD